MDHLPTEELKLVIVFDLDLLVQRDDDSCIYTLLVEFDRKASYYVSKTSDLNKRTALG